MCFRCSCSRFQNIHKLLSHDNTRTRIYVHFVMLTLFSPCCENNVTMKGPLARAQGHRESTDTAALQRYMVATRAAAADALPLPPPLPVRSGAIPLPVWTATRLYRWARQGDGLSLPPTASVERQSWTRAFVMCARAPAPPGPARPGIRPDNGTEPNPGGPRSRAGGVTGGEWVAAAAEAASWGGGRRRGGGKGGDRRGADGGGGGPRRADPQPPPWQRRRGTSHRPCSAA